MSGEAVLGVDLGGTQVRVGKVRDGCLERCEARRISGRGAAEAVLAEVFAAVDAVCDAEVAGIGCGVPSVVDVERGVVYAVENIPAWREVALGEELARRYGVPAVVDNDANAFAVGELHFGAGRGCRNLVGMTIGTGLGAGIVIDGRLYRGTSCGAGELGAIPYRDATVEDHCSGRFFRREAGEAGDLVFERAQAGDAAARSLFHAFGRELGHAVMIALYAYDPERIVLGGSISRAFGLFAAGLRERLVDFAYQHALARVAIVPSTIEQPAVLGAAALFLDAAY